MGKCFSYRLEHFHIAKMRCAVGGGDTRKSFLSGESQSRAS